MKVVVCIGSSCHIKGSRQVVQKLQELIAQAGLGDKIELEGRIQSRKYFKRYSPDSDEGEYKEVYEISIWRFRKI